MSIHLRWILTPAKFEGPMTKIVGGDRIQKSLILNSEMWVLAYCGHKWLDRGLKIVHNLSF